MQRFMLKSKVHRATVTEADINYEGSLSLCPALMEAANLLPGEKVLVANIDNGSRLETYLLAGRPGQVCLNGAAARLGHTGDKVIILSFCLLEDAEARTYVPAKIVVDEKNRIERIL